MQMCHSINPLPSLFKALMNGAIRSFLWCGGYLNLNDVYIGEICAAVRKSQYLKNLKLFQCETYMANY